jgi:hypothetical protein
MTFSPAHMGPTETGKTLSLELSSCIYSEEAFVRVFEDYLECTTQKLRSMYTDQRR